MEDFKYISELFISLKEVFKKPVLLLPFLYIFILGVVFSLFTPNLQMPPPGELPDFGVLSSIIILTLLQLFIALIFYAMGLMGMRMYANGENVTHKDQASKGIKLYWKLLLQKIYLLMIFGLPAIALLLIYRLVYVTSSNTTVIGLLGLVLALAFTVYIIAVSLFFLFSSVIIAYEGKSALDSLKESYRYFKQNMANTVLTLFSLMLFVVIVLVLILLISVLLVLATQSQTIMFLQNIIMSLIIIVTSATMMLYLFKAHIRGRDQKSDFDEQKKSVAQAVAEKKSSEAKPAVKPAVKSSAKAAAKPAKK